MTLVAAFRCPKGGIMLCADREENDGYTRREVQKIYETTLHSCQVFTAGSGPSGLAINAQSEIANAIARDHENGVDVLAEHKRIIEGVLRDIHKRYKAHLKSGNLELLIVVAPLVGPHVPLLYRTEWDMLVASPSYAAAGSGKAIADYLADRLYEHGRLDKDSLKVVGAFILREAEKAAAGVGMGGEIHFIHEGGRQVETLFPDAVKAIQDCLPGLGESLWSHWKENVKIPKDFAG
jgi:20S proteasome alpha/beta subunit